MNEEDKTKIRTAATIFLLQHPEGLTAKGISDLINQLPRGIKKGRGYVTSAQVAHYMKTWSGYTSSNILRKKRHKTGTITYYLEQ